MAIALPLPKLINRSADSALEAAALREGYTPFQARLIAARLSTATYERAGSIAAALKPSLATLDNPAGLPDFDRAVERIARAVVAGETIALVTDHDVDGVSSMAVLWHALRGFGVPDSRLLRYCTHRLTEGYGISHAFVRRLLDAPVRPTLAVSADQGSSNCDEIAVLAAAGVDVVVTDHHAMSERGVPERAYACVTPARADSRYPDPNIAGCMVAWLVMTGVRRRLEGVGALPATAPPLRELLDLVAVGTVADCVSLGASLNNRAVIGAGLALMRRAPRPSWNALDEFSRTAPVDRLPYGARDLGFTIGPRLNAGGRLDEASAGVNLLIAPTLDQARPWASLIEADNAKRKEIEAELRRHALALAAAAVDEGRRGLVLWLEDGHPGIHGISASRVVEAYGHPTICLSPKAGASEIATGSARSCAGVHMRDALADVQARIAPGLLRSFGGHAGAAGLTLERARIPELADAFDRAVAVRALPEDLIPTLAVDGPLPREPSLSLMEEIEALEPTGRGHESALFADVCAVESTKAIGDGTHVRLKLRTEAGARFEATWFNARGPAEAKTPPRLPPAAVVAYSLERNSFRGRQRAEARIKTLVPLA